MVLFREQLGRSGWAGIAGIAVASGLVSSQGGWPGVAAAGLVAAACVCWGLDNHWTALIDGMRPEGSTFWKGLVAGSANLAIGLSSAPFAAGPRVIATALVVGALCYGASIVLYIRSAHQLGATRAQGVFASAPFIGAALSFGWLGEDLAWEHVAGAAILVPSIAVLFWSQHEHLHVHEPLEHVHVHRHDDGHHTHAHPELADTSLRHGHWHRHEPLVHRHPTGPTSITATRTEGPTRARPSPGTSMSEHDRERWDARYRGHSHAAGEPPRWLDELDAELPRGGRALDVAAGTGRLALWLARRGLETTAVDVSGEALRRARARAEDAGLRLETLELDLEKDPLPPGPFALIGCCFYLQREIFPVIRGRLAPGGCLVCELPTRRNLERHARPGPRYLLEPGELLDLVAPLELVYYREGWLGDRALARAVARAG